MGLQLILGPAACSCRVHIQLTSLERMLVLYETPQLGKVWQCVSVQYPEADLH